VPPALFKLMNATFQVPYYPLDSNRSKTIIRQNKAAEVCKYEALKQSVNVEIVYEFFLAFYFIEPSSFTQFFQKNFISVTE